MPIRLRPLTANLACVLVLPACIATAVRAGDYVVVGAVNRIADRCAAQYGETYADTGDGVCARSTHTRVYVAPRNAGMSAWSNATTSNPAVLRTDGTSMVPGAPAEHLRVRGNLDTYSPFR